jgi:hypothetical protein
MPSGGTRRELADSFRLLVTEERWLFAGLVGGTVGYVIWVAGTAAAVEEFVGALAAVVGLDPGSTELWLYALLWVVVPSLVAVRYVVDRLTNLRGNVEQCYRVDQPLVLLGPPAAFVLAAAVFAVVRGTVGPVVLVALGAANVVLLVRTVAYGYRVYSLSVPRLLQGLLLLAATATSLGLVCRVAPMAGKAALVESVVAQYGLDGTVPLGASSVPLLAAVGATAPGIVAVSYVWVQVFAGLIVRIRRPDVPRSAIRAGQRYPQVVQPGTDRRLAMGTAPDAEGEDTDADADGDGASDESGTPGASTAGTDGGPDAEDGEGHGQRFGQTRVYTPPEEDESTKSELCPICGETYAADAGHTNCPNCNAVIEKE